MSGTCTIQKRLALPQTSVFAALRGASARLRNLAANTDQRPRCQPPPTRANAPADDGKREITVRVRSLLVSAAQLDLENISRENAAKVNDFRGQGLTLFSADVSAERQRPTPSAPANATGPGSPGAPRMAEADRVSTASWPTCRSSTGQRSRFTLPFADARLGRPPP